ncbi:MAG: hypothetical protein ACI36Y_08155 [Coriobacteriales bacterium]
MTTHVQPACKPGSRLTRLAVAAVAAFAAAVLMAGALASPAMAAVSTSYNSSTHIATFTVKTDSLSFSSCTSRTSTISYAMVDTTRSDKVVFINDTDYYIEVNGAAKVLAGNVANIQYRTNVNNASTDKVLPAEAIGTQTTLFKYVNLAPGEQISCYAEDVAFGSTGKVVIGMQYKTNKEKPVTIQQAPDLKVTKIASNEAAIRVKLPNTRADVSGVTQVKVYAGSKVIKTFKSRGGLTRDADSYYKFRYVKSGAGTAKYKAVATTIAKPTDTATSKVVKPAANKATLAYSKKLTDYKHADTVITSLSYSGGKLVVKGKTVNPCPMALTYSRSVQIIHNLNNQRLSSDKQMTFAKGFKSFTLKFSTKKVIDLNDRHDYLVGSQPPVFA